MARSVAQLEVMEGGRAGAGRGPARLAGSMSFVQLDERLITADISAVAFRVYALLSKYARQKDECWPSEQTMCAALRLSERHLRRALAELVAAGLLEKRRTGHFNTYELLPIPAKITPLYPAIESGKPDSDGRSNRTKQHPESHAINHKQEAQAVSTCRAAAAAVDEPIDFIDLSRDPWNNDESSPVVEPGPRPLALAEAAETPQQILNPANSMLLKPNQEGRADTAPVPLHKVIADALRVAGLDEKRAGDLAVVVAGRGRGIDYVWSVIRASREPGRNIKSPVGFIISMLKDDREVSAVAAAVVVGPPKLELSGWRAWLSSPGPFAGSGGSENSGGSEAGSETFNVQDCTLEPDCGCHLCVAMRDRAAFARQARKEQGLDY